MTGLLAGVIMLPFYHYENSYDFVDENYFQDYGEEKKGEFNETQ